jgi:hypothetical protein
MTVTYGTSSAPFMKKQQMNQELHSRATQVLYSDFYVNLLSGASTLEEAMHLQQDISALL